ncbi:1,4-alpha-glucan branching protein GlgB [Endozoicomonas sp. SCSIO W0465]|uniref:1,4-alpha-glucan branching protein GlgB n=1 Tax=Endozoicomonas sp. SCSIO W0465 TaxID=2918516 RepID=UPI0020765C2B|nr:1,4-alpha-glucan branching protein GlgB [Endozoicomonas sp. SCSIO W0465]USE38489.1 1,4-alpha-glucan branching protein GlgB [Endozoicomonas sp. SCSIO W0465]
MSGSPDDIRVDSDSRDTLLDDLLNTCCARPFDLLGWHPDRTGKGLVVRIWRPDAIAVDIIDELTGNSLGTTTPIAPGLFERSFVDISEPQAYHLLVTNAQHHQFRADDPYQFSHLCSTEPVIRHHWLHHTLGAHLQSVTLSGHGWQGVMFRLYAPHARSVSVIGSFNHWDGRLYPMASSHSGIWRLFIPDVKQGDLYKFELKDHNGQLLPHKADPFSFYAEQPPGNASIVYDARKYQWQSKDWHQCQGLDRPVSIYEVHLGSWKKGKAGQRLNYVELAEQLVPYVKEMGFTHVEFLPLHEHPFNGSWGYQPVGLFAATSRYGDPDGLKALIDRFHDAGVGVILDWVPAHFPSDSHGLASFDGTHLYEYEDPRRGWHPDWQTHVYNYGRSAVRNFLISNALFWFEQFHVDGLRVDAVASMLYLDYSRGEGEWEPNILGGNEHIEAVRFIKELNEAVYLNYPDAMMIAEESTSWPGVSMPTYDNGLGFGYKWNMGWMNDTLNYMTRYPEHRRYHHDQILFSMVYNYSEHFILPLSHDEVVHGKGTLLSRMPGDEWQQFANLRALYGYMFGHPGKKLLFMGAEIGSRQEWNHDDQLDWYLLEESTFSSGVSTMVRYLNSAYQSLPALWRSDYEPTGFQWLITDDELQSVIAFSRHTSSELPGDSPIVVICNFTPVVRQHYRLGVPEAGVWIEAFNSDRCEFSGSGVVNQLPLTTEPLPMHHQLHSLVMTLPPLATVYLHLI